MSAQLSIQSALPLGGIIQKNALWNIIVTNTSLNTYDCHLELVLRDRKSGQEVLTATTGIFQIIPGAKQFSSAFLAPIQYHYINPGFSERVDDFIPVGNYIACFQLSSLKATARECISFDVEPLSPPMLIVPADSSLLLSDPSQFVWVPPSPLNLFSDLKYEMVISEIIPGQKATEAIQQNLPFYTESSIYMNNLSYKGRGSDFEKDKWYAWQIIARDNNSYAAKSEVWVFKINEPERVKISYENSPFVKMKKYYPEKAIAHNGDLKFSYINETSDSSADLKITDLSSPEKPASGMILRIKPGENLVKLNVIKELKLKSGKLYKAELINSRNEKWQVIFEIFNYNK